ncbi:phytanoyl-CoA dioxygenase family protein [Lacisediminimonas sp.]|uniref:phytanoyl-CoA dioxygenase family protein n=1 Tax=Lacisediminimonas sp. TaxID=3060582 RepID=UPI002728C863|nr:phytanoyl-CoA dioxygenase family protein [Lacisediminimonas sp.]MDO8299606.1 phytanoyl-CoA dioxygenase family protein [Lacisediminimonas sp.]
MSKLLTSEQTEHYKTQGYITPIRVMSAAQANAIRQNLEEYESQNGGPLKGALRHKTHLLFKSLNDLVRHEKILDAIEDLYGENLLCWTTNFFIKEANDAKFVSWHQDSTYWGLSRPDVVTAWVALSESNESNGAMQVIPGTHLVDQIPHRDTFSENNLLTRGQEVAVDVDPAQAVLVNLEPGEMSLHHVRLIHGSPPNTSSKRRIGFAIRYIPTSVRQVEGADSATLVRGVDTFNTFEHEPQPMRDFDPAFVAMHAAFAERTAAILYKGTGVASYDEGTDKLRGAKVQ